MQSTVADLEKETDSKVIECVQQTVHIINELEDMEENFIELQSEDLIAEVRVPTVLALQNSRLFPDLQ